MYIACLIMLFLYCLPYKIIICVLLKKKNIYIIYICTFVCSIPHLLSLGSLQLKKNSSIASQTSSECQWSVIFTMELDSFYPAIIILKY